MSAYFHTSISFSFWFSFSFCCRPCVYVYFGVFFFSWPPKSVAWHLLWVTLANYIHEEGENPEEMRECDREDPDAEGRGWCHPSSPRMWLTQQHPLASRPPLVAAKARFSVKLQVCDAWELTTELGTLPSSARSEPAGDMHISKGTIIAFALLYTAKLPLSTFSFSKNRHEEKEVLEDILRSLT